MADYEKSTVAALRALLKDRGIPSTGLTRKAQIIQKLVEHDAAQNAMVEPVATEPTPVPAPDGVEEATPAGPVEPAPSAGGGSQQTLRAEATQSTATQSAEPQDHAPPALESAASAATSATLQIEEPSQAQQENEPPQETPAPPAPTSAPVEDMPMVDRSDTVDSATGSRIPSTEFDEDRRKRKRRSATPPLEAAEIAAKRAKVQQTESLPKDESPIAQQEPMNVDEVAKAEPVPETAATKSRDGQLYEGARAGEKEDEESGPPEGIANEARPVDKEERAEPQPPSPTRKRPAEVREGRFQSLVRNDSISKEQNMDEEPEDTPAAGPALHPATAALYIRNFQRPLREEQLRERLILLATPKGGDPATLELCHLDAVRTHAFVLFTSMAAAARVRSSMHDKVWPQERDRKPLWVDYIPEDQVQGWIDREKAGGAGPRAGGKRWEVVYDEASSDGEVLARLQEVGAGTAGPARNDMRIPTGPRADARSPPPRSEQPPRQAPPQPAAARKTFQTLDSLFKSTAQTKPKLYYQPVAPEVVEKRQQEIATLTKRDWDERSRRPNDELRRYTFEDGDVLVDSGPHFMSKKLMAKEGITSTGTRDPRRMRPRGGGVVIGRREHDSYRGPREGSFEGGGYGRERGGGYGGR